MPVSWSMAATGSPASRPSTSFAIPRTWNWWRGSNAVGRSRSISPTFAPHALADGAGDARRVGGSREHAFCRRVAGNFEDELGTGCFFELLAVLDRDYEGPRPTDDAIFVIDVELLDIERGEVRTFEHDRQAVDGDALRQQIVARERHQRPVIVDPV